MKKTICFRGIPISDLRSSSPSKSPVATPHLCAGLHNYTFGAMPSVGLTGGAITGIKYGVRRLVSGLVRDLFREDAEAYYRELIAYSDLELESLESAALVDRPVSRHPKRLGGLMLGDLLGMLRNGNPARGRIRAERCEGEPKAELTEAPSHAPGWGTRSRNRAVATRP